MPTDRDAELMSCFWTLHAAIIRRDGLEDRMRHGATDRELFDWSLEAAEEVLAARGALWRHLMARGWTPPTGLVADLAYDEIVLSAPDGAVRG